MKQFINIILIFIFILIIHGYTFADENNQKYFDSGFLINNKKIWILDSPPYLKENSVCTESDNGKKDCIFACYFCGEDEKSKKERAILPVDGKGIFYVEDEFNLKFYNIESKKDISISSAIGKMLKPYEIDHDMPNLTWDDRYFNPFTDKSLNAEKNKLAIEIVYNDPATMATLTSMVCIVDINKLSADNEDYIECPVITEEMRNLDYAKVPGNTWKSEQLPVFNGWTDNKTVEIKTKKGDDFVLNVANNTLEEKSRSFIFNKIFLITVALVLFLLGVLTTILIIKKGGDK